jgi:hypothetical protein
LDQLVGRLELLASVVFQQRNVFGHIGTMQRAISKLKLNGLTKHIIESELGIIIQIDQFLVELLAKLRQAELGL